MLRYKVNKKSRLFLEGGFFKGVFWFNVLVHRNGRLAVHKIGWIWFLNRCWISILVSMDRINECWFFWMPDFGLVFLVLEEIQGSVSFS